jgi:hypothetical protein
LSHDPHLLEIILFNVREKGVACTNEGEKRMHAPMRERKGLHAPIRDRK